MLETYSLSCESGIILVISYLRIINYNDFKCIVILHKVYPCTLTLVNKKISQITNKLVLGLNSLILGK
jgi:hypothetical protein